jgi:hypothetical protein
VVQKLVIIRSTRPSGCAGGRASPRRTLTRARRVLLPSPASGLRVEDEAGREIGTVADILKTGAGADVLVVKGPAGESLVPLVASFVRQVDLERGRLVTALAELVDAAH